MIIEYVRKLSGEPVGVLIATKINEQVVIGWSLCRPKGDVFNKQRGKEIAFHRAELASKAVAHPPIAMTELPWERREDVLFSFFKAVNRAAKYFKVDTMSLYVDRTQAAVLESGEIEIARAAS